MRRILALSAVVLAAGAAHASGTSGVTYYVSPSGSDSGPGTASAPWRTLARVDNASLAPGDSVLFQGGATFSDQTLVPPASGASGNPITFGSYGSGKASIANSNGAVWIPSTRHDLVFTGLDLSSSGSIVFASAGSGLGTSAITLRNSTVRNSPYAGVVMQPQDSNWLVVGNTLTHLGDSGLLVQGNGATIDSNTVSDTGWNTALSYGKHGIYAKGPNLTISNNDFSHDVNGSAVSLRYRGAKVFGNSIHDTPYAISLFPQDPTNAGIERIYNNKLWNVTGWAFYYNGTNSVTGQTSGLDVIWTSNTTQLAGASEAVNVSEVAATAHVTVANSVFAGTYTSAYRGCTTCSEHNNDWYGGTSNIPSGAGDQHTAPGLSAAPALSPSAASPIVDRGTVAVTGVAYAANCDGRPMDYCMASPDQGAVEFSAGGTAADTSAPTRPAGLTFGSATQTGGTLAWSGSTDNVGVAGYDVYLDGARVTTLADTTYSVSGLSCGTSYTFGVVAVDAAGNRSATASASGATAACTAPPPSDRTPPTVSFLNASEGGVVTRAFTFQVVAADASGISSLGMSVDGRPACSTTSSTLSCPVDQKGWDTVTATAVDTAGNSSSTSIRVHFSR
jgi:chitodextrinase